MALSPDPAKYIVIKMDGSNDVKAHYAAGRSAAALLKALVAKLKTEGTLRMEDGPDVAGDEDCLEAGTYMFTPAATTMTTAVATDDQPEWHRRFVMEKFDPLTLSMSRELSATRSASKAKAADVDQLFQALRLRVIPFDGDPPWEDILALHDKSEKESAFWDERPEPWQREEYIKVLQQRVASSKGVLEIRDARSKVLKNKFKGATFPISSSNDVSVSLRSWHNVFDSGTVAGVELKKKLRSSQLTQLQMEFLLWAQHSHFPIVQFLTDFTVGGAALYYSGRGEDGWHNITLRLFKGMDAFWAFFSEVTKTAADACGTKVLPPVSGELPNPKRVKLHLPPGIKEDEVGEYMASYFDRDIANLDDLACFGLVPSVSPDAFGIYG